MSEPGRASANSALALIEEGNALEEQGRVAEAMTRYDAAVQADPRCARAHLNRGNVLLAAARIDAARDAYQLAIECDARYAPAYFNLGNLECGAGRYEPGLRHYRSAIDIKPQFYEAHVAMGNALATLRRTAEAAGSYERALAISPGDAGVYFNLGLLAMTEGRIVQAVESFRRAIALRRDYPEVHYALGKLMGNLGHLDEAETNLRRASALMPESDEYLYELALVLVARSKSPEGVQLLVRRLGHTPTWMLKTAFATCVARTRFTTEDPRVRAALTAALIDPWTTPSQLCWPALSMVMLEPTIARCVRVANESWPARLSQRALFGADGLSALAADSLLLTVLTAAPVNTIELERFLTGARHALLEAATGGLQCADAVDIGALEFYAALSRQCFINEYVWDCDAGELAAAGECRTRLLDILETDAAIPPLLVLAVAAYFPLHTLPDPTRFLARRCPVPLEAVVRQQISEPLLEQTLRAAVRRLTPISAGVSEIVRDQYEKNPYPRWVKVPVCAPQLGFNAELRRTLPLAQFTPMADDRAPQLLVAGCGTGGQAIATAQRFRGVRVLAVDLSLSSISYALRKTQELGIGNIEYAHADILRLGDIGRTFDIIACGGVLHHLADPFAGWRMLLSQLRPGGFMQLGFYSRLARRHVARAREIIAARGYASTPADIRRFRQALARDASPELQWLSKTVDFYSTSECRDLLFHVQEHCLTLDQIELFLSESGSRFLGFELDPRVLHRYRTRYTDDPAATDLRNWTCFETDHPDTFAGMYQFWIQKPVGS